MTMNKITLGYDRIPMHTVRPQFSNSCSSKACRKRPSSSRSVAVRVCWFQSRFAIGLKKSLMSRESPAVLLALAGEEVAPFTTVLMPIASLSSSNSSCRSELEHAEAKWADLCNDASRCLLVTSSEVVPHAVHEARYGVAVSLEQGDKIGCELAFYSRLTYAFHHQGVCATETTIDTRRKPETSPD